MSVYVGCLSGSRDICGLVRARAHACTFVIRQEPDGYDCVSVFLGFFLCVHHLSGPRYICLWMDGQMGAWVASLRIKIQLCMCVWVLCSCGSQHGWNVCCLVSGALRSND